MKKKLLTGIGVFALLLVAAGFITNYADSGRIQTGHEPKYCIKTVSRDGSKVTYWGLGYKIVRYVGISPNEPYESNTGVKMGSWFMEYEPPIDSDTVSEPKNKISSLDDFYNNELTKGLDIRELSMEYSSADAQKDGCFVIGAMVHNDHLYDEFMEDYKAKETSFIRVAQNTADGDLVICDVLYYQPSGRLYLVVDNTRDHAVANPRIQMREFESMAEYECDSGFYWVAYNGELTDETFQSDSVFVLAKIN